MSTSPYPGLRPFHRDEADIFFGRDEQVDQLLIRLGKSRFLAVVGPSGCGKSSLVHTGLLNALEAGFLADVGLHWRIATMQPGSHPMRNLAAALVEHIRPDTDRLNMSTDRSFYPPLPSGDYAVDLSSAKPSPAGEGWVTTARMQEVGQRKEQLPRGNQNKEKSLIITPHPSLLPEGEGTQVLKSTSNGKPRHDDTAFLLATLRRGPLGLIEALREQPLPGNTNLLLVVDQFEEIFRYREHQDRDEADAFVALLLRSVQDSAFPVYIVITMRSDFLGDCALFPGLPEALNDSQFLTPRLNREQRRLAITGPARVCGGDVEPALVNRLLNDMGADPDQLPVLQHALMRLWTDAVKQDNKPVILKIDDYETLGGWDNTLSNHADEAFAELDKQQQTIAEIVFRALTERSGAKRDTRRPVSLQAVAGIAGVGIEQVISVIEVFRRADRSFVMPPEGHPLIAETLIDISHESLIRQWQRMKEWVEQEAQSADTYRRLEQTALLHSQKRAGLLQGLDLIPVLEWKKREQPSVPWAARYGKDFELVMRFLAASERWHRVKSLGKILGFAVICLTAGVMTWLWLQADTERKKATSAHLLAEGQLLPSQPYPISALWDYESMNSPYSISALLGIEAMKRYPHPNLALNQFMRANLDMLPRLGYSLKHGDSVTQVVFSPDGKLLATASDDKMARLWDTATGRELHRLNHSDRVTQVVFSPDGKLLATASDDKMARLWETATGQELQRLNYSDDVNAVTFSPDGKRLATASDDKIARLWDTATGRELHHLSHDAHVNEMAFSPDGKQLATASDDKIARLWDTATGREIHRLNHSSGVNAITFSPDGKQFATTGDYFLPRTGHNVNNGVVHLWDTATGQESQRLIDKAGVNAVTFSPDGKQLATTSIDKTVQLWDTATGQELYFLNHDASVNDMAFSPDGKQLATASKDNAQLWDTTTHQEFHRLNHNADVNAITFSPDGKQLATASDDKMARLWDTTTGQELLRLSHDAGVNAVAFSPNGKQLATASDDKIARLWDTATGRELLRLNHEIPVIAVTFSPDGKQLATASDDKMARLWDTATGRELHRLSHSDRVNAVTFSPDGKRLATASDDKMARLWDTATGRELHRLNHEIPVIAVTFSPDGKQLATTSGAFAKNHTVHLWDATNGQELQRLTVDQFVDAATFNPDGKQLATGSRYGAWLWDTKTGRLLRRLNHETPVIAVAFSPDGKQLATVGGFFDRDYKIDLWDAITGQELQHLYLHSMVTTLTFSPDGKQLATINYGSTSTALWLWQPEDLISQLCSRLLYNLSWDDWQTYFESEPYRKTCELLPVAPNYQKKGKQLVKEGKTAEAIRMIQQLNAADPTLKLDQEQTLRKWEAPLRWEEAKQLLEKKKITDAVVAFNRVEQVDSEVISAESWNKLCWEGALGVHPAQVLDACEKAVGAATDEERWKYQDSRGLARALTGNSQGAIEDFEALIQKSGDENRKKQRQAWVQALQAGQNPFTKEELATLQNQ